ncbi:alpha/beta fold hydrolase [Ktedonobacter racemifer]|uniref:Alpha/beta hydrolase fold protein n=1 Tax=Ktedonobacter racemifer DSM 44963 TaxID=485913 RepID=D6U2L8_KTERA|nr:alpha/beta hydrolase [Ktedonobacter racemifer]EFH80982.1 alpha/beta hydrolase fold protein [Ktedonobacter racemifer DSM 44963]
MKCDLGDFEIFYETYGAGRPIVMLPGRPSDHHIMERLMEPLFTQRTGWLRIYPDLPGTGLTPSADRLATHDQMLDAVLAFIDTVIPGQRFVLAGLSYGGYLARGVISRRAALIDGLLLCAPQVKADLSQTALPKRTTLIKNPKLLAQLEPGEVQLVEDLVVVENSRVIEAVRNVLAEVKRADHPFNARLEMAGPSSFEVDPQPISFGGPTLIVTARQDHLCGYQDAWDLLDNYPRATFAVLDQAGHFVNIEQDELCRALMREWLDRVEKYASA